MKFVRISPTKITRIADLVRGATVGEALDVLRFLPHRAARLLEKGVKSARANAENAGIRSPMELKVIQASVNSGPTMKRIQPHARGMGFMIKKRSSHIVVVVGESVTAG